MIKIAISSLLLSSILLLTSCSSDSEKKTETTTAVVDSIKTPTLPTTTTDTTTQTTESVQMPLMATSDCYSCHKEREDLVGPSFLKIAEKYNNTPKNVVMLAEKVINGGVGTWGQVPMQAHPTLSKEDAAKMVAYILTIK